MPSKISFVLSIGLIVINILFLFAIVKYRSLISYIIFPGLTVGILGVMGIIVLAILLTWVYVTIVNSREFK